MVQKNHFLNWHFAVPSVQSHLLFSKVGHFVVHKDAVLSLFIDLLFYVPVLDVSVRQIPRWCLSLLLERYCLQKLNTLIHWLIRSFLYLLTRLLIHSCFLSWYTMCGKTNLHIHGLRPQVSSCQSPLGKCQACAVEAYANGASWRYET